MFLHGNERFRGVQPNDVCVVPAKAAAAAAAVPVAVVADVFEGRRQCAIYAASRQEIPRHITVFCGTEAG